MKNKADHENHSSSEVYEAYMRSAFDYLKARQEQFLGKYKISNAGTWDWNQDTGLVIFSEKGQLQVEAQVHVAGTWSRETHTWMWAWANTSFSEKVRFASSKVKEVGERRGFPPLTTGKWRATEAEGWKMSAILAKEINAIGACRNLNKTGMTYLVVTKAKWVNKSKLFNLFREK